MSGKKYFVLMEGDSDTTQVFVSKHPRGAALKAATRGHTDIELSERGTNKVHCVACWTDLVDKPKNGPKSRPAKIKKAKVKKSGTKRL